MADETAEAPQDVEEPEIDFVAVGKVGEFPAGAIKAVAIDRFSVCIVHLDDGWHAFSDYCTHVGAPLSSGWLQDGQIYCPYHYACFNISTGDLLSGPGYTTLPIFQIRVVDDEVQVQRPIPRADAPKTDSRYAARRDY